jgi:hypothetical protein
VKEFAGEAYMMMRRAIVCVATGERYGRGLDRLIGSLDKMDRLSARHFWRTLPAEWPRHEDNPYAFKAFALMASAATADLLLWCDASMRAVRPLGPLWDRIEREGFWMGGNPAWSNYQWTADSAYADLFPELTLEEARKVNRTIPHGQSSAFGINLDSEAGAFFLREFYRLADSTRAFCGPKKNLNCNCGPADVIGHRQDQTVATVLAWRVGIHLSDCEQLLIDRSFR